MKIALPLAAVAILVPLLMPSPAAADTAALQAALRAAYLNQCALVMAGNYPAFANTMTPDYLNVDPNGKTQDRDQAVADAKQGQQMAKVMSCDVHFTSTTQNADGSVVAAVTATQNNLVGGAAPAMIIVTENDTWVRQNGSWLMKSSKESEVTLKVNGNVVEHLGGSSASSPAPAASP